MIGTISILLLVMWGLYVLAYFTENEIFMFIAGSGLILFSIYIMINGLEGVDNFVTKGLSIIQIGIGLIGIFAPLWAINDY